ncbi:MAG: GNAT family N-acetyltransferase [Chloroflexi bacterium]|nr:GNAT family N-acetyltransferase [Chloroflexota bacterium]
MFSADILHLRAIEPGDAPALHTYLNRPELIGRRYLPNDYHPEMPLSSQQIEVLVEHWSSNTKFERTFAVVTNDSDHMIGHVRIHRWWDDHAPSLDIAIDPQHWRKGFGTAALDLLLTYLFKNTVAHSISGWIDSWNEAGLTFAEKHGFSRAGARRRAGLRDGAYYDEVCVDLLRREWKGA